jgi:uncharacterized membrane protein YoaK (UPF0700 family)
MKPSIPLVMSINAGYVDTAGFLALQGLFTAHVTGNFVTLGAALVLGTSGAVAKLLALPVFCAVVVATRVAGSALERRGRPALRAMLALKLVLLVLGAALAIGLGPFAQGDSAGAIVTGMVLVAAMAIQNAVSRIHLGNAPPTTLMTGSTTQMMIDLADLLDGVAPEAREAARGRLARLAASVAAFAAGCAVGAALYHFAGPWCFAVPPLLALAALASAGGRAAV